MDPKPPESPIVSFRDFLLEIAIVTCGVVIALALGAAVQWNHDRTLRRQVRDDFVAELSGNETNIRQRLPGTAADTAMILGLLEYGTGRLAHQAGAKVPPLHGRGFTSLGDDAWQTALATQGIGQLSHPEVRALATAYDIQKSYNDLEAQALRQWLNMAGYGDPAALSDDDAKMAMREIRTAYALQATTSDLQQRMLAADDTALRLLQKDR